MARVTRYSPAFLLFVSSLAFAQAPQTPPPSATPGPGRGGFVPIVIGPAAPVPPEVAIPRPTPSEIAQVNQAVSNWIASNQSEAQPLLKKLAPLLMLKPPRFNVAATYTQTQQRIGPRHERFVE